MYPFGVDELGNYSIVLNTDIHKWGGDTQRNKYYRAKEVPHNGKPYSIEVDIPPLGALYIRLKTKKKTAAKKPARKKKQDK